MFTATQMAERCKIFDSMAVAHTGSNERTIVQIVAVTMSCKTILRPWNGTPSRMLCMRA